MEEDCGAFAADCIVLSCCCQCLVLQVTVFVFLKIPRKLANKLNKFVKRRRRLRRCGEIILQPTMEDEHWSGNANNAFDEQGLSRFNSMEQDIEGLLSMNKEFVFGSFWRHQDSSDILDSSSLHSSCVLLNQEPRKQTQNPHYSNEEKKINVTKARL